MKKLNECEIAQNYVGKNFNEENLLVVSYQNGTSYPENHPRFISDCYHYKQEFLKTFALIFRLNFNEKSFAIHTTSVNLC